MTVTTLEGLCSLWMSSSRMLGRPPRIGTKTTWKQLQKRTRYVSQTNHPKSNLKGARVAANTNIISSTPVHCHSSVGDPSSQLILCAYDRMLDTRCSFISSPAPTATLATISFRAVLPKTSMWAPEFAPPRRSHDFGECLTCSTSL